MYNQGDTVREPGTAVGIVRPPWLVPSGSGSSAMLQGTAYGPSGSHIIRYLDLFGRARTLRLDISPVSRRWTGPYGWFASIVWGEDRLVADGTPASTLLTVGTPELRWTAGAPMRAVILVPGDTIMRDGFTADGWSSGAVRRGMEMRVAFGSVHFVGRIYEVSDEGSHVRITAYDRLMDAGCTGGQTIGVPGSAQTTETSVGRTWDGEGFWQYRFPSPVGTVQTALDQMDVLAYEEHDDIWADQPLRIQGMRVSLPQGVTSGQVVHVRIRVVQATYGNAPRECRATIRVDDESYGIAFTASAQGATVRDVDIAIQRDPSANDTVRIWIADSNFGDRSDDFAGGQGWVGLAGEYVTSWTDGLGRDGEPDGRTWTEAPYRRVTYDAWQTASIPASSVTVRDGLAVIMDSAIPSPALPEHVTLMTKAENVRCTFLSLDNVHIGDLVAALATNSGLPSDVPDLGTCTYYDTGQHDALTIISKFADASARMPMCDEEGVLRICPRYTVDDTPAAVLTTEDPTSPYPVLEHRITRRWMADKATWAVISEDTAEEHPISMETDDALLPGSLSAEMGIPMRGSTADDTLGDRSLLAVGTGGRILQSRYNVIEGTVTVGGYLTSIWMPPQYSQYAAGMRPVAVRIPEYGTDAVAVPTEVTYRDGRTIIALDNVRRADRSEVAVSMGLTADAISNSAYTECVHIFARVWDARTESGGHTGTVQGPITLYSGDTARVTIPATDCRVTVDPQGWTHISGYAAPSPTGYSLTPIDAVRIPLATGIVDAPATLLAGQQVHVDLRIRMR